ncbi:MAG: hypothetical protein CME25_05905 [Gemmatimonadetes bacterium]|nr:hypothetical protein [Gemmatimonadota bacterium]
MWRTTSGIRFWRRTHCGCSTSDGFCWTGVSRATSSIGRRHLSCVWRPHNSVDQVMALLGHIRQFLGQASWWESLSKGENFVYPISIYLSVTGKDPPLPLEHDLTGAILDRLNARASQVNIGELRDGAVYAELVLEFGEDELRVEVCPGDSIVLALKYEAPIYTSERVL